MTEQNYSKEILQLGYNQNNMPPKLTPITFEDKIYIFSSLFGVVLEPRTDKHVMIVFLEQDDGYWFKTKEMNFSNFWLGDLAGLLNFVQVYLKSSGLFEEGKYGYVFKSSKG